MSDEPATTKTAKGSSCRHMSRKPCCQGLYRLLFSTRERCTHALLAANVTLLLLGTTLFVVNISILSLDAGDALLQWAYVGMIIDGVVVLISGISGLVLTYSVWGDKGDAFLSSTTLPLPYLAIELTSLVLNALFTLANMALAIKVEINKVFSDDTQFVLEINYVLGFCIFLATLLAHISYHFLLNPRLESRYVATEVDIKTLENDKLMKLWGDQINAAYGTKYIGAWDGHGALSLMKAMKKAMTGGPDSPIPFTRGVVLRIDTKCEKSEMDMKKKQKSGQEDDAKLEPDKMEEGEGGSLAAVIFITVSERFDLASYVTGCCGSVLSSMFGASSCIPILTLRWGVVGFQWPFHGGIFLTRKSDKPIDDMSQVQRALVHWNRVSKNPCNVLMAPCYITQLDSYSFECSHFLNLEVGPSVIVDLRRYHGMEYKTFQRVALKKGNRRNHIGYFEKKGGTYTVSRQFQDFDAKHHEVHASLCGQTAQQRVGRGEARLICPVTPGIVKSLQDNHMKEFRRVFGIRVNGEAAGAAMLFEFPKSSLMTSDMQGLQHEIARPAHAYFAMLALTVELCLKERIDFLDFGPTTLDPKLDVGGRLIPTRTGYYTHSVVLRSFIKGGLDRFRQLNQEVEDRLKNEKKTEPTWAWAQPYVEIDFQHLTPALKKLYNVQPMLIPFPNPDAEDGKNSAKNNKNNKSKRSKKNKQKSPGKGGNPGKKTKKQLNKERAKQRRKNKKAAEKAATALADAKEALQKNPEDEKLQMAHEKALKTWEAANALVKADQEHSSNPSQRASRAPSATPSVSVGAQKIDELNRKKGIARASSGLFSRCVYVCVYVYMCVRVCMCVYVCVCVCVCV